MIIDNKNQELAEWLVKGSGNQSRRDYAHEGAAMGSMRGTLRMLSPMVLLTEYT
jgi:hypothetical protein